MFSCRESANITITINKKKEVTKQQMDVRHGYDKWKSFYSLWLTKFDGLLSLGYCISIVRNWELILGSSRVVYVVMWDRLVRENILQIIALK